MNDAVPAPPPAPAPSGRLARWREAARRNPREWFANWLTAALILRLILVALPIGFWIDIGSFQAWSNKLAESGPMHFYESIWSDYPPVYMYVLWLIGLVQHGMQWIVGGLFTVLGKAAPALGGLHVFLVKLPAVAADILNAWLIFKLLEGRVSIRTAYRAALVYAFNPITLFISAIWGQMDAVLLSALLGAIYFMLREKLIPCILLTALAVLIKPQGLFLVPAIVVTQWWRHRPEKWAIGIAGGLAMGWLLILPFTAFSTKFPGLLGPVGFMWEKMQATAGTYPYSSVNAFNLWMPTKMWQPDNRMFLALDFGWFKFPGFSHQLLGLLLLGGTIALTAWAAWKQRAKLRTSKTMLIFAIVLLACFLLPTRMHERYLFPAVAMLAIAAAFNRNIRWNYFAFSATALINVLYAFLLYNTPKPLEPAWTPVKSYLESLWGLEIVMLNMWIFGDLIGTLVSTPAEEPERKWWEPVWRTIVSIKEWAAQKQAAAWEKADWLHMGAVSGAFFLLAVWNLYTPNEEIFDEVYHARTAKEFIDGTNPYEWTHPHLGKLVIAAGILVMNRINKVLEAVGLHKFDPTLSPPAGAVPVGAFDGFDGFGWRIGSLVVGALVLCALYILARRMFQRRRIATIAAGLLALDGVFWVQSRVAMTNIYVTFFLLVGCIGLWEYCSRIGYREDGEKRTVHHFREELWLLLWGLGIGGALASRWSSLFAWGIGFGLIGLHWLVARRKWLRAGGTALFAPRLLIYVVLIPVLVYVATYIPWFLQKGGHTLAELWQMQKNMWGYHAGMVATHNYQSPWWTWPFMHRPTWYYFHDWKNGTISGIVAIGNPAIWWLYVPIFGLFAYHLWKTRDWRLAFLLAFGTGLWFGWGIQPRNLVFMHYLFEAIPFLCIGLACLLDRLLERQETKTVAYGYLAVAAGLFLFWYPLLTAIPVKWLLYSAHIWVSPFWY